MPDPKGASGVEFARAALLVETALRERFGAPERLTANQLAVDYRARTFARGWRIPFAFEDGIERHIDLLLSPTFPTSYPRTALVDRPEHMTWPHVEHDGILCLLPIMAEVDHERPTDVALNLLGRSGRLIEELLAGRIVDRDFREEFLTYWFYSSNPGAAQIESLVAPEGPTRLVRVWRGPKGSAVVGEDDASLQAWLQNSGREREGKSIRTEPAVLLARSVPPLPSEYPMQGSDILALAETSADLEVLAEAAVALPKDLLIILAAEGRGGAGLIAMTATAGRKSLSRSGRVEEPLTRGFRAKTMPEDITVQRTFGNHPVHRSVINRADPQWVHGRGKDPRTAQLLASSCTVIGCGSVGSSVAARLARAGVGTMRLVDHDKFEWSNLGRHELGAASVGLNKAEELAQRLKLDFPHLTFEGIAADAHMLMLHRFEVLKDSDLVIIATGSWRADAALNKWHIDHGRSPPFLYGWTESHAAAAHAVTIGVDGGCLRCGIGRTGRPTFEATDWPEGATLEEPACGNHFQPYGAVELGFVVDRIAEAALSALLTSPTQSSHALWLAPTARLEAMGGMWTDDGRALLQSSEAGHVVDRAWPDRACTACSRADIAA